MRPDLIARLRLFGFLALLVPLFSVLHGLIEDGIPRVEIQLVPRIVPVERPIEVIVERIVERLVYIPVPTIPSRPWVRPPAMASQLPQAGPASAVSPLISTSGSRPL